jgi:hypothetical protein
MMVDSNDSYKKYAHSGAEAIQLGRKRHLAAISQRPLSKRALSTRIWCFQKSLSPTLVSLLGARCSQLVSAVCQFIQINYLGPT